MGLCYLVLKYVESLSLDVIRCAVIAIRCKSSASSKIKQT